MASLKKRPAAKSKATKPVSDEQLRRMLADALPKLAAALNQPKKGKSAPVRKQPRHYIVKVGGSKTPTAKTTKSVPLRKGPKYIEVDASTRQLAGSIKPSRKPVIRRGRAKLDAKGEERIRHDRHDRRDQLSKLTGSVKLDKPLRLPGVRKQSKDQGESRSTTKLKAIWERHRKLYIAVAVIGTLIGCAGVAVGVYFAVAQFYPIATTVGIPGSSISASAPIATTTTHSTPMPFLNETKGLLTYEAICVPHHQKSAGSTVPNVSVKECVAGYAPNNNSCSGNGTCGTYSYQAILNRPYNIWTFNDTTLVATVDYEPGAAPTWSNNATRLLCRTAGKKLGLCDGNDCVNARVEDDSSWYELSRWADTCGKPSPCWYGDNISTLGNGFDPVITRSDCLSKNASELCRSYAGGAYNTLAAVVWFQHIRCEAGSYSTTAKVCPGLPFRLWRCAMCNGTETPHEFLDRMCDEPRTITSACSFFCKVRRTPWTSRFYLPNGAECFDSTAGKRKYCYGGTCFKSSWKLDERTRRLILPQADCEKKKNR